MKTMKYQEKQPQKNTSKLHKMFNCEGEKNLEKYD